MKAKIGKKQDAFRLRHKRSTYYFVVGQGFVARCLKSATWITAGTVQSVRADYGDKASDIEEVADHAECDCWRCRKAAAAAGLVKWTGFTPRQPGMEESMALHKYKVTITHSMLPTVHGCLFAVSEEAALAMLDLPAGRHAVVVQIGNFSACFYDKQFDQFVRYGNRPAPPPEREGQVTESPAPAPQSNPLGTPWNYSSMGSRKCGIWDRNSNQIATVFPPRHDAIGTMFWIARWMTAAPAMVEALQKAHYCFESRLGAGGLESVPEAEAHTAIENALKLAGVNLAEGLAGLGKEAHGE